MDSATFVASAVALALMRYRPAREHAPSHTTHGMGKEAAEGLRYLLQHRGLTAITALLMGSAIGLGASYPLVFLYAVRSVGGGTRSFGLMESAIAVGLLAGAAAMAWLGDRVPKGLAITVGVGLLGACLAVLGAVTNLYGAMAALALAGAANSVAVISINTYFQQTVPRRASSASPGSTVHGHPQRVCPVRPRSRWPGDLRRCVHAVHRLRRPGRAACGGRRVRGRRSTRLMVCLRHA